MKRLVWLAVALAALVFAVQGGEYGTSDLFRQRARKRALELAIDSLRLEVDSLARWRKALATDPELQERIAREEFWMVRGDREILYRFTDPAVGPRGGEGGAPR